MRGGVHHPLILLIFTPEKDKDPPLMALLGVMGPYIIIRSLAQRMRFKKEWLLDCLDLFTTQHIQKTQKTNLNTET